MDNQRLAGSSPERIYEAGHTLSTIESYLGIQNALRKLRAAGGTKYPGAWAGAVVFNGKEHGIVVLTSQEKWDGLKAIFRHFLSDQGFIVYVIQAYLPMVPYLKGIYLTLETWRGGRDSKGWKLNPNQEEYDLDSVADAEPLVHDDDNAILLR